MQETILEMGYRPFEKYFKEIYLKKLNQFEFLKKIKFTYSNKMTKKEL